MYLGLLMVGMPLCLFWPTHKLLAWLMPLPYHPSPTGLPQRFLRMCRGNLRRPKVSDWGDVNLTGAGLLMRTWIFRRLLRRYVLGSEEKYVAVLLPPSVAAVVANAALSLDRRITVNLNYTAGSEVIRECIGQCSIRHILTSRRVMERLQLKLDADLIYVEDLKDKVTWSDKLIAATVTWILPVARLEYRLGLGRVKPDDVITVIFTSGTTGRPTGVMLTHRNVGSNIDALDEILGLCSKDVLLAILPFFILSATREIYGPSSRWIPREYTTIAPWSRAPSGNSRARMARPSSSPRPRSCVLICVVVSRKTLPPWKWSL
jgi:acyl-CoA synthetase (AMP-forming)/AMP-acid ligase II